MTLYERYITDDDNQQGFFAQFWVAQTFTVGNTGLPQSHTITSVKMKLFKNAGTTGTTTVSIRATDGDGKPTGEDLCSGTMSTADITDSSPGVWYEFSMGEGVDLYSGQKYAIVIRNSGGGITENVFWRYDGSSPAYSGGSNIGSGDSGSTWTVYENEDLMFEEYGTAVAPPPDNKTNLLTGKRNTD